MRVVGLMLLVVLLSGCEGPPGPPGADGDRGPVGPAGPAGTTGAGIVETRFCVSNAVNIGPNGGVFFTYAFYKYADGSVMTTCEIYDTQASHIGVSVWRSFAVGAANGSCTVGSDVDAATAGFWDFTLSNNTATAKYDDDSSASDGRTISAPCPVR